MKNTGHLESKISEISFNLNKPNSIRSKDDNHSHSNSICVLDMTCSNLKGTIENIEKIDPKKGENNFKTFGMNFKFTQKKAVTEVPSKKIIEQSSIIKDYVDPQDLKRYL